MPLTLSQEILSVLTSKLSLAFRPPPKRKLWEWAEENIILSPKTGTFSPGRYRTRHTPHVRAVMDAFENPDIREIVLPWGAQTGKTLTETICICGSIDGDPGNILVVMPSELMAKSFSTNRLQRVIMDSPSMAKHRLPGRDKWNKLEMELDNCSIALTGAGSASNLASRAIRILILDELDKYPGELGDEGSPSVLAEERTKSFPNKKVIKSSTVTIETGPILSAYAETNQQEWFCSCPKCVHKFYPQWKHMVFDKEGKIDERAASCRLVCPKCEHGITEKHRRPFLAAGEWVATNPDAPFDKMGFRISELASCIGRPWQELVKIFIAASHKAKNGDFADLKTFVCSVLAEPWKINSDTMRDAEEFREYCDGYPVGIIPAYLPVSGLTIGIDTQDNGFYFVVRAWGGGDTLESWQIDHGFCDDFASLERVCFNVYRDEEDLPFRIRGGFIDSMGHRTAEVYNWCRSVGKTAKIIPTKGEREITGGAQFAYTTVDKDRRGKPKIGGLQLCRINTTLFKDWLDGKLKVPHEAAGAWHVHDDITNDYCLQMSSEYRDENGVWQLKKSSIPNHYWDCEVLALARAVSMHLDKHAVSKIVESDDGSSFVQTSTRRRW